MFKHPELISLSLLAALLAGCQTNTVEPINSQPTPMANHQVNVVERDASASLESFSRAGAAMRVSDYEHTLYNDHLGAEEKESDRKNMLPPSDLLNAQKAKKDRSSNPVKEIKKAKRDRSFYSEKQNERKN